MIASLTCPARQSIRILSRTVKHLRTVHVQLFPCPRKTVSTMNKTYVFGKTSGQPLCPPPPTNSVGPSIAPTGPRRGGGSEFGVHERNQPQASLSPLGMYVQCSAIVGAGALRWVGGRGGLGLWVLQGLSESPAVPPNAAGGVLRPSLCAPCPWVEPSAMQNPPKPRCGLAA